MTTARALPTTPAGPGHAGPSPARPAGVGTAYRWEITKLAALVRTRAALAAALVLPPLVVLVLNGQTPPVDTLYGRYVHDSGYAVPLLLLGFATQFVYPLLTSLVAGDIFASEDHFGTWKTVLTRSVSRSQVFWAKTLAASTFAVVLLGVLATSSIVSSLLLVGHQPLTGLTGQTIAPGRALGLVAAAWATDLPPLIGFTALAILLSVVSRNPAVGVVGPVVIGFVMSLVGSVGGIGLLRPALLTTPLESWHGLFTDPSFHGVIWQGVAVSAVWTAVCLFLAYSSLRRRDITGG
ncbi:ABC transporter permease [Klenkia brasiliensis]|uniref:ABC-2 type transport system permease protein n=1 Tax=Klenkia brasiliensis TaxID=333142 RepID=A0A1G7UT15_9ACTN|nr:ABC transporter permease [Klenkia brasiliensis]SDG49870.1 ABC-2 type transport system permease protein [Klenkia brasiliensis]